MKTSQRIANWNRRARERGLPNDLTAQQWNESLSLFAWCCAYCGQPYSTMDHYYPLGLTLPDDDPLKLGSTAGNCLPCCWMCNQNKGFSHPLHWDRRCAPERLEKIHQFVEQHAERKRRAKEITDRFNVQWARTYWILVRLQQYAALQTMQGRWDCFGMLAMELEWECRYLFPARPISTLQQDLEGRAKTSEEPGQAALYQDALHYLHHLIDACDPEHLTLES